MALCKIEGRITVPTAGYSITANEGSGDVTVLVLPAGNYYPNSATAMLSTIATALTNNATLSGAYNVTSDDDATTSAGKVTIAASGVGTLGLSWPDTTLRDILGFTGSVSGATSHQSPGACQYIYLPPNKRSNPLVPDGLQGMPLTDGTITISPSGYSKALKFADRYVDNFEFRFIPGSKAWTRYEVVANESWQSFWGVTVGRGIPLRYHTDRAVDGTYVGWRAMAISALMLQPEVAGWVGDASQGAQALWAIGPFDLLKMVE